MGSSPIGHPIIAPQKWQQPPLKAGASAGAAFAANVRAAVAQIRGNARSGVPGRDPEHLHQLRIGIRRLRSTLRAFRGLIRHRRAARFDSELRSTLRALGAARDWDVFLSSPSAPELQRAARRSRAAAHRAARSVVSGTQFRSLVRRATVWARSEPWRDTAHPDELLGGFGARALQRLYGSLSRAAQGIDWSDAERRHRVRIRLKRLRYACECFMAAFSAEAADPMLHRMRALQHLLGELNDIQVRRNLLGELALDAALANQAERAGRLLAARERALIRDVEKAWWKLEAMRPYWRRRAARAPA